MNNDMEYLKKENITKKIIRTELLFIPLLISLPFVVGLILVYNWYTYIIINGLNGYESELILGLIIIIGNLIFDIPFIKSLKEELSRKNYK